MKLFFDTKSKSFVESIDKESISAEVSLFRLINCNKDPFVVDLLKQNNFIIVNDVLPEYKDYLKEVFDFYYSDSIFKSIFRIEMTSTDKFVWGHFHSIDAAAVDIWDEIPTIVESLRTGKPVNDKYFYKISTYKKNEPV